MTLRDGMKTLEDLVDDLRQFVDSEHAHHESQKHAIIADLGRRENDVEALKREIQRQGAITVGLRTTIADQAERIRTLTNELTSARDEVARQRDLVVVLRADLRNRDAQIRDNQAELALRAPTLVREVVSDCNRCKAILDALRVIGVVTCDRDPMLKDRVEPHDH